MAQAAISNTDNIISMLEEFGIERDESLFYISLLQAGPSTVNIIASKLHIERGRAYRILHKLQNLSLISTTFSNPALCTASEPEKALSSLIHKKESEIITLKKLAAKAVKELDSLKNTGDNVSQLPSFYIIQGRSNIYSRIGKIIEESKKIVYIATTKEDVMRMYHTAIPEKIKEAVSRGIKIMLLVDADDDEVLNKIDGLNASQIRTGRLPSESRIIVLPDMRLIMSGHMNKSMSLNDDVDSILYTNSLELVKNMESLFLNLWNSSKKVVARASEKREEVIDIH